MAAASASALPANMVAEMTWNVVSVMSRSMACTAPGGARRQRADLVLGRRRHGRHQAGEIGGTEQRRRGAPLPAPAGALRGEDAVAQRVREHPLLQRRLGELRARLQQHLLDQRGIGDPGDDVAAVVVDDDRLLVDRPRQAGERIAHEASAGTGAAAAAVAAPPPSADRGLRLRACGQARSSLALLPASLAATAKWHARRSDQDRSAARVSLEEILLPPLHGRTCRATAARTPTGRPSSNWRSGT